MDNTLIFLSGFCVGLFIYWLLWGPKKKKVNDQEYAFWELGSPFVRCSNCGKKSFDEVKEKLQSLGFDLSSEEE